MDAYVKVKGIEDLCYVPSIKKIITMSTMNHESSEITDFEALRIYSNWYITYSLVNGCFMYGAKTLNLFRSSKVVQWDCFTKRVQ